MSSDLAAFIAARLDEDEAAARALGWATRWHVGEPDNDGEVLLVREGDSGGPFKLPAPMTAYLTHIARHDPARVLRRVEAGRRILTRYEDCLARMEDPDYPHAVARDQAREYEDFVLPNLAAEWGDHPDYRAEWKP